MIFQISLGSSSAAVAAAFLMAAPTNANVSGEESADEPLSAENHPYIPRSLSNGNNNDLDVNDEGIQRSLSIENTLWPPNRGYQPTLKNSFRVQTDNYETAAGGHDASADLGVLDTGFSHTSDNIPVIKDGDRVIDDAEPPYYGASPSDTSTNSARNLSDNYCYEKCGPPSQRPIIPDDYTSLRNALSRCGGDITSSNCPYPNVDIQCWNVSEIRYFILSVPSNFNEPLGCWDLASALSLYNFFSGASDFNQNINRWNVSGVIETTSMFRNARSFNSPLNYWDMSSVRNAGYMFSYAYNFDQPIQDWDVSSVTNTEQMFNSARAFNQPLDEWDVSSMLETEGMINNAVSFNQCLSTWSYKGGFDTCNLLAYTACPNYFVDCSIYNYTRCGYDFLNYPDDAIICDPDPFKGPWCQGPEQGCFARPPSQSPSNSPTKSSSPSASFFPSTSPTISAIPSNTPSSSPSVGPTKTPTEGPSKSPTGIPSENPSESPSGQPSASPSASPTIDPCKNNSETLDFLLCDDFAALPRESLNLLCNLPNEFATSCPELCSSICLTPRPTESPTASPTAGPTAGPTSVPTSSPTAGPTAGPTSVPTASPTASPTSVPTSNPTSTLDIDCGLCSSICLTPGPTESPTASPTAGPTAGPTSVPTSSPTAGPTANPTLVPTSSPTPKLDIDCEDKSKEFKIAIDGVLKTKDCEWVASKKKAKKKEYCKMKVEINGNEKKLPAICKKTCGELGRGECGFLKDN